MSDEKPKFLQIDEEGFLHSMGVRWEDPSVGREIFKHLSRNEYGVYQTQTNRQSVILEAFDTPLVALRFEFLSSAEGRITLPYEVQFDLELQTLRLDEWDRFHGRTKQGFSFVLSRNAQTQLFEGLDDYDDESITLKGSTIAIQSWPGSTATDLHSDFWSERHRTSPGWDLGGPHPSIEKILPQIKLNRCRILVSGAGAGHDAAAFARAGNFVGSPGTELEFAL